MTAKRRRLLAAGMAVLLTVLVLAFACHAALGAHHDHGDCPICACLWQTRADLQPACLFIFCAAVALIALRPGAAAPGSATPVAQKIRADC